MKRLRHKKLLLLVFLILSGTLLPLHAMVNDSSTIAIQSFFVDDDQKRIDKLDGTEDSKVQLVNDIVASARATHLFQVVVDSIQFQILRSTLSDESKVQQLEKLFYLLREVNHNNVSDLDRFTKIFRTCLNLMTVADNVSLMNILQSNTSVSLKLFPFFKNRPIAAAYLLTAANRAPDIILSNFYQYEKTEYVQKVVDRCAREAPNTVRRYFIPGHPVQERMRSSEDPVVKIVVQIHNQFGKNTNAYTLVDAIYKKKISIAKADSICKNQRQYFITLLDIRAEKRPAGAFSLERELELISLKYIREINDLHNEPNDEKRFACVKDFTAEELYTLMVYGQEEIFTSTFNGCFKRFLQRLEGFNGREFLYLMGENRFRSFIKICSGFGKLNDFFATMTSNQRIELIKKIARNLEADDNGISQAIEIADAFGSIKDSAVVGILGKTIVEEYYRVDSMNQQNGKLIYGLLMQFVRDRKDIVDEKAMVYADRYKLLPFDAVKSYDLFGNGDHSWWLIYFYDDEDGEVSFSTFIKEFTDKNWIIRDSGLYVIIESLVGKAVNIYANKPKAEYDGQEVLQKFFSENNIEPNVVVHRGHSYYAYKTIEKLGYDTRIFVLGSCGGYNAISSILERAPDVNIISSKQIGTMFVNNPMLKLMAEATRNGADIIWPNMWDSLQQRVIKNKEAYGRFLDYIPPHKNLSAIFIRAYNNLLAQQ